MVGVWLSLPEWWIFLGHVKACKWKEHLWYRHVDMYLYVMHEKITAQLL